MKTVWWISVPDASLGLTLSDLKYPESRRIVITLLIDFALLSYTMAAVRCGSSGGNVVVNKNWIKEWDLEWKRANDSAT